MNQQIHLLSDDKLEQIATGKMWDFHGGVHPEQNKLQSNQFPIVDASIANELIISVEHKGQVPELLVRVGDPVLKGQPLTKVYGALVVQHATSSGKVKAIEPRTDCHPSGLPVLSIVIETDGLDTAFPSQGFADYKEELPATLVEVIQQAGIIGLGGAGFPTHLKLKQHENRLLIINAIECEPYITSDDRLTQEYALEIIEGTQVLQHILKPKLTIFAIEDNKPEAIEAFTKALQESEQSANILLRIIPTRYPSGSGRQLIEILTGEQTPIGKHSSDLGICMVNVGTAFAVKEAIIDGQPLISRIVTLTGDAFTKKGNVNVRIGTPIQHLLDTYSLNVSPQQQLIIGGPMMGFTIKDTQTPVSKICNCILAPSIKEAPKPEPEMSCIRCSECAEVCPAELLPQQLLWYSQSEDHKKLQEYDLSACIECGACAFVCPSHIPLVEYYRVSKAQIKTAKYEADKAAIARKRHEDRELRLEKEKEERQLKHKLAAEKRKQQMKEKNNGEDVIAAALARAKAKKEGKALDVTPTAPSSQVAAAIERAKAKKRAMSAEAEIDSTDVDNSQTNTESDPKKAAIAAAVARAKAKKLAAVEKTETDQAIESETEQTPVESADPKKAAIAAAIARAKAKKLAAAEKTETDHQAIESETEQTPVESADPKKAAIAAAIARAKAKKLAAAEKTETDHQAIESETEQTPVESADPKKAAIAAAIARAKAKKLAAASSENTPSEPDNTEVIKQRALRKEQARLHKQQLAAASDSDIMDNTAETEDIDSKQASNSTDSIEAVNNEQAVDDKKAKIAAVIAKAKAKKLAEKDQ
ncbi:electron transport complex subunit RsxC [Psychromonas sp.]|nr:electron transport complex subunit RsxC [Psychromonas sp.]